MNQSPFHDENHAEALAQLLGKDVFNTQDNKDDEYYNKNGNNNRKGPKEVNSVTTSYLGLSIIISLALVVMFIEGNRFYITAIFILIVTNFIYILYLLFGIGNIGRGISSLQSDETSLVKAKRKSKIKTFIVLGLSLLITLILTFRWLNNYYSMFGGINLSRGFLILGAVAIIVFDISTTLKNLKKIKQANIVLKLANKKEVIRKFIINLVLFIVFLILPAILQFIVYNNTVAIIYFLIVVMSSMYRFIRLFTDGTQYNRDGKVEEVQTVTTNYMKELVDANPDVEIPKCYKHNKFSKKDIIKTVLSVVLLIFVLLIDNIFGSLLNSINTGMFEIDYQTICNVIAYILFLFIAYRIIIKRYEFNDQYNKKSLNLSTTLYRQYRGFKRSTVSLYFGVLLLTLSIFFGKSIRTSIYSITGWIFNSTLVLILISILFLALGVLGLLVNHKRFRLALAYHMIKANAILEDEEEEAQEEAQEEVLEVKPVEEKTKEEIQYDEIDDEYEEEIADDTLEGTALEDEEETIAEEPVNDSVKEAIKIPKCLKFGIPSARGFILMTVFLILAIIVSNGGSIFSGALARIDTGLYEVDYITLFKIIGVPFIGIFICSVIKPFIKFNEEHEYKEYALINQALRKKYRRTIGVIFGYLLALVLFLIDIIYGSTINAAYHIGYSTTANVAYVFIIVAFIVILINSIVWMYSYNQINLSLSHYIEQISKPEEEVLEEQPEETATEEIQYDEIADEQEEIQYDEIDDEQEVEQVEEKVEEQPEEVKEEVKEEKEEPNVIDDMILIPSCIKFGFPKIVRIIFLILFLALTIVISSAGSIFSGLLNNIDTGDYYIDFRVIFKITGLPFIGLFIFFVFKSFLKFNKLHGHNAKIDALLKKKYKRIMGIIFGYLLAFVLLLVYSLYGSKIDEAYHIGIDAYTNVAYLISIASIIIIVISTLVWIVSFKLINKKLRKYLKKEKERLNQPEGLFFEEEDSDKSKKDDKYDALGRLKGHAEVGDYLERIVTGKDIIFLITSAIGIVVLVLMLVYVINRREMAFSKNFSFGMLVFVMIMLLVIYFALAAINFKYRNSVPSYADFKRAQNVFKETGNIRFPELTDVDLQYEQMQERNVITDPTLTLEDICTKFRNYMASELNLFYDIQDVRKFITSLGVSKLMVLQGMSGTGKTSIAVAFGKFIGVSSTVIPVQPMWKEKSDLLGYYNEFTGKFNETKILYKLYEANYSNRMNIIVLDEMNIARVEYYFSEFLSLLELPPTSSRLLQISASGHPLDPKMMKHGNIVLPDNVWFLGTANNDDSTFAISDKVYDRAMIMNLNNRAERFVTEEHQEPINLGVDHFYKLAANALNEHPVTKEMIKQINELDKYLSKEFHVSFGNRIMMQIKKYIPIYMACGGTYQEAIDDLIAKKILRKLESQNLIQIRAKAQEIIQTFDQIFGIDALKISIEYINHLKEMS